LIRLLISLAGLLAVVPLRADLAAVRAEPNLERRAGKALDNADRALKTAQETYRNGYAQQSEAAFEELRESVVLANDSLKQTGKNPSRSPKHFKRAEIRTRELLRRLNDFRPQMSLEDRGPLEKAEATIQKIHEELLAGIMGGKKKKR
jgi:hypothetical protein